MIQDVVNLFKGSEEEAALLELIQGTVVSSRYQDAMRFVIDCRGQDTLKELIRNAVLRARARPIVPFSDLDGAEKDVNGWYLRPAVEAVGQLVVEHPRTFSEPMLTSNFDPLLEISIRKAGGKSMGIFLAADGQFSNVLAPDVSKVVHFHGYWRGGDTLHAPSQLTRNRPQLKGGLRNLLRETTLVVMAYGGWSDVFTRTLVDVISEQTEQLNVLWTFYSDNEEDISLRNRTLLDQFAPLAGQRVLFYKGIDCHVLLPRLRQKLVSSKVSVVARASSQASEPITEESDSERGDSPPQTPAWVGREFELRLMLSSSARVITITGIGGTGKSTLAAKYLQQRQSAGEIAHWYWADCREKRDTLRTQLVRMVERVSRGEIRGAQLRESDSESVVEILLNLLESTRAVLVFDNIDQLTWSSTRLSEP